MDCKKSKKIDNLGSKYYLVKLLNLLKCCIFIATKTDYREGHYE